MSGFSNGSVVIIRRQASPSKFYVAQLVPEPEMLFIFKPQIGTQNNDIVGYLCSKCKKIINISLESAYYY